MLTFLWASYAVALPVEKDADGITQSAQTLAEKAQQSVKALAQAGQQTAEFPAQAGQQHVDKTDSRDVNPSRIVDYVDIVNANRESKRVFLSTDDDDIRYKELHSKVIDHGSFYEVTHCRIMANTSYDVSVMDGKTVNDTLQPGDCVYRITDIESWMLNNGETVYLEYASGADGGYYELWRSYDDSYYTPAVEDGVIKADILYTGNLYFSKDCVTMVNNPQNEYKSHYITIGDYLTRDKEEVGGQFGLCPGGLMLWGDFEMDSTGLIVGYTESFLS